MIIQGDCLEELKKLEDNSIDLVVTDPPYSSGGLHITQRKQDPTTKYSSASKGAFKTFGSDQMDQRVWMGWCEEWLKECSRIVKPGHSVLVFIDWRQLPAMTDCIQRAGLVWQGVAVWDKQFTRPRNGGFVPQAEYIVWASSGQIRRTNKYPKGVFSYHNKTSERYHLTQKPVPLLRDLIDGFTFEDEKILDPFAGSGTTCIAAKELNRQYIGIEREAEYVAIAEARLAAVS